MRVGIMGTRGIPNEYGGFEQFAMHFAQFLVEEGVEVVVYNSSSHPFKESSWKGVEIVRCWDPEKWIGSAGQFVYDLGAVIHARKQQFDILFQLGYTSSSIWGFLFPKKTTIITNMDGQEWKRAKYGKLVKKFLKRAERWAVNQSDILIADSRGIQEYLSEEYAIDSQFIAYGANVIQQFDSNVPKKYKLMPKKYNLVIARMEPENNIETIIRGHRKNRDEKLVVVGNLNTPYGKYLSKLYADSVVFLGSNYNFEELNSLRYFANLYFHGHSVGGTNPSLLEAMACGCQIVAHNNPFNRDVLEDNALYFSSYQELQDLLDSGLRPHENSVNKNKEKLEQVYSFKHVHHSLKELIDNA